MTESACEYLIWSNKHGGWWRQNRHGYTTCIQWAGIFSEREAHEILATNSRGAQTLAQDTALQIYPDQTVPNEVLIPIPDGHPGGPNCPPVMLWPRVAPDFKSGQHRLGWAVKASEEMERAFDEPGKGES